MQELSQTYSGTLYGGKWTNNRMSIMNCTNTLLTRFSSATTLNRKGGGLRGASTKLGIQGNGGFRLLMGSFLQGGRFRYPQHYKSRGVAIRCETNVSVSDGYFPTDAENFNKHSCVVNETDRTRREPVRAAFFDVDGTITRTNVVFAYLCVRMSELGFIKKLLWVPWFLLSCLVYLIVDSFHRPTFNRIFYSSYKGRTTDGKTAMAKLVFENYYKPRIMAGAAEQILELKRLGYLVVLVTGSLDFLMEPLAEELGAGMFIGMMPFDPGFFFRTGTVFDLSFLGLKHGLCMASDYVYAAKLVEENGRFTGRLQGMGSANHEKAERIWEYAKRHGVSLRESLAFGDSIADIPMLEVVGKPFAVNPDTRLLAIALKRGWAILNWKVKMQNTGTTLSAT